MPKIELDNIKMWESLRNSLWHFPQEEWLIRCIDHSLWDQGLQFNPETKEIESIEKKKAIPEGWYVAKKDFHDDELDGAYGMPVFCKGECTPKEKVFNCIPYMTEELFAEYFELPDFRIQAGKWYMCLQDLSFDTMSGEVVFKKGTCYQCPGDMILFGTCGGDFVFNEYMEIGKWFRPATPEEIPHSESKQDEMTEFEQEILLAINDYELNKEDGFTALQSVQKHSYHILKAAHKQLRPDIDAEIEKAYKTQDEVQYRNGYNKCLDKACEWLSKAGNYVEMEYNEFHHDMDYEGFNTNKLIEDFRKALEKGE